MLELLFVFNVFLILWIFFYQKCLVLVAEWSLRVWYSMNSIWQSIALLPFEAIVLNTTIILIEFLSLNLEVSWKKSNWNLFFFQAKKNESVFLLRKQSIKIDFGNVLLITTECIYWKIPRNGVGRSMSKKIKMFLVLRQICAWLT